MGAPFPQSLVSGETEGQKGPAWVALPDGVGETEGVLMLAHQRVKESWPVFYGKTKLGKLDTIEVPSWSVFSVGARSAGDSVESLRVDFPQRSDRVQLDAVKWFAKPLEALLSETSLEVAITDEAGAAFPVRITVIDAQGYLAPVRVAQTDAAFAKRTGVVYSVSGTCRLGLMAGTYQVFVTRGPEYERLEFVADLNAGESKRLSGVLTRSVETEGWVSCDTHTHTFTMSRHGDATLEERVITFAGEALEFPVATDHNILTDYSKPAVDTGTAVFFTPVIGDEVTTKEAHFNVFPLAADSRLPDFRILDWPALLGHFRSTPDLKVVILNHPHNVHNGFQPFSRTRLNPISGRILKTLDPSVDAMEVLSSSAQQTDMMVVFRDWFALLNRGHRIVGLGSSDVHDVNRYIVGQGRTYLKGDDRDPGALDVSALCGALLRGEALISMGLFVNMHVGGNFGVGDTVTVNGTPEVSITVSGPSWIRADRVELFANGERIRSRALTQRDGLGRQGQGWKAVIHWDLPEVTHDTYLVAMATGDGDLGPSWPIPYPYQPSGGNFVPRVAGATNPIYLDIDRDGKFSCARELGQQIWRRFHRAPADLWKAMAEQDVAVVVQVVDAAWGEGVLLWDLPGYESVAHESVVRNGVERYRGFVAGEQAGSSDGE